jgi:hypothetical protein
MKKELKKFTLENYNNKPASVIKRRILDSEKNELGCFLILDTDNNRIVSPNIYDKSDIKEPRWIEDTILESGDYIAFCDPNMNRYVGQFDKVYPGNNFMLKFKSIMDLFDNEIHIDEIKEQYDYTCICIADYSFNIISDIPTDEEIKRLKRMIYILKNPKQKTEKEFDFDFSEYEKNPENYNLVFGKEKYPARLIEDGGLRSDEGFDILVSYVISSRTEDDEDFIEESVAAVNEQGYQRSKDSEQRLKMIYK